MNKHIIYSFIADNLEWFQQKDGLRFLTCRAISRRIKEKDGSIKVSGSTLTAMVYDGVLERVFVESARCYAYRPILPIKEEYKWRKNDCL